MDISDNYDHIDPLLIYSPGNVPGPGFSEDNFVELDNGCECTTDCEQFCYHPGSDGSSSYECGLLSVAGLRKPVFECNSSCSCEPSRCGNRKVQLGPSPNLKVSEIVGKGLGLFTLTGLRRGQFVCEYAGEIINEQKARERFAVQTKQNKSNYILVLREFGGDQLTCKTIVDPTAVGNIGRYANHSCNPNLVMVPVRTQTVIPHLALFAARDIHQGEELCFDYGDPGGVVKSKSQTRHENTDQVESKTRDDEAASASSGDPRTKCACGAQNCKGYLPFDRDLLS